MKLQWILLAALVAASAIDSAQSCSPWRWVKCGAVIAGCVAACIDPLDPACIACLGPLYKECKSCIGLHDTINGLVTLQGAQGQTCSSSDWVECGSRFFDCEAPCDDDLTAPLCSSCLGDTYSKCTYCLPSIAAPNATVTELAQLSKCSTWVKVKCAAKVARCATICVSDGITSTKCISCFGSSYKKCKGCLPIHTAVQSVNALQAQLSKCSTWTKVKCAAKVARCATICVSDGITSSKCISCFGSSYQKCKGCLPFHTAVQSVNALQGCSTISWLRCAGAVARCSAECIDHGFRSPQCFQCLGSHYQACILCISSEDIEDMRQLAIAQRAATTLAVSGAPKQTLMKTML